MNLADKFKARAAACRQAADVWNACDDPSCAWESAARLVRVTLLDGGVSQVIFGFGNIATVPYTSTASNCELARMLWPSA